MIDMHRRIFGKTTFWKKYNEINNVFAKAHVNIVFCSNLDA